MMAHKNYHPILMTACLILLQILFVVTPGFGNERSFSFVIDKDRTVLLKEGDKLLWQYNADLLANPRVPTEDARFMAGCYIHPLYGINGEILTDDAPKDHYHHHGVFWNWPTVKVHRSNGKVEHYDTWMSKSRMKPLFVRFLDMKIDAERATFKVENGWFIGSKVNEFEWDKQGNPVSEKVVSEFVTVTTHANETTNGIRSRAVDLGLEWIVGEYPITLKGASEKSYGGLTVRFRPSTSKSGAETTITVPDGVAKEDLPDTPLPWADFTSRFERDSSGKSTEKRTGAAIFVPKDHPDYPPTWLTRYYGPLCVGWPGVKERTFQPGEKINLSYRIWIHDKPVEVGDLEKAYQSYTESTD